METLLHPSLHDNQTAEPGAGDQGDLTPKRHLRFLIALVHQPNYFEKNEIFLDSGSQNSLSQELQNSL